MDISTKAVLLASFVVAFTGLAAYVDWRTHKIPNWLTMSCFVTALVFHFVAGLFVEQSARLPITNAIIQVLWALAGFATGFSILFVLWLIGGGGGGDVKMMGALGAWFMPTATLYIFILTFVFTVLFLLGLYVQRLMTGEHAKQKKARRIAELQGKKSRKSMDQHWAPYAFRAALASWVVMAYFIIQQRTFPFL